MIMPVPFVLAAAVIMAANMAYIQKSCVYGKEKLFSVVKGVDNTMNKIAQSLPAPIIHLPAPIIHLPAPIIHLAEKPTLGGVLRSRTNAQDVVARSLLSTIVQQSDPQDQEIMKHILKEHFAIMVKGLPREVDPKN